VVADNVAFGLLRKQTPQEHGQTNGDWEHYRNDDAARAHKVLSRLALPLELLERRDVGPGSSNQWLLVYRRA
jgi:hypothetical protein